MHPVVKQVEDLFLPYLERLASEMRERFQSLTFKFWRWPSETNTEYIDYDLGVECLFPKPKSDTDNVALMIELCFLNSKPRLMASVGWGAPSAHSETTFRDDWLTNAEWPEANPQTIEELRRFFPTLVAAFESAVERGTPSA
jgi:hypothetical protein